MITLLFNIKTPPEVVFLIINGPQSDSLVLNLEVGTNYVLLITLTEYICEVISQLLDPIPAYRQFCQGTMLESQYNIRNM